MSTMFSALSVDHTMTSAFLRDLPADEDEDDEEDEKKDDDENEEEEKGGGYSE